MKKRIEGIKKILPQNTAALITSDSNRFYLSGMKSSAGYIVITDEKAVLLIDFRYFEKAKQCVTTLEVVLLKNTFEQIKEILGDRQKLLVETDSMSITDSTLFEEKLGVEVLRDKTLSENISQMRSIKSEEEIGFIKAAQKLTDDTFSYILPRIETGRTEKEIMLDMEFFMRKNGSEGVSFDFIVVSGKNSSLPHGVPTDKKIEKGDFITMDFGAVINGYCSDMTRTVAVGNVTDEQKKVYNTVLAAQEAAIRAACAGKNCVDIDQSNRYNPFR